MFYILTCGSTASIWLSRALSLHPEIVCFHGVKTLAAAPICDRTEPLARQFVRDLGHLYWAAQGERIFGAIHGFAAVQILPEIAAVQGAFAAMIRHPVTRLNSLFHRQCQVVGTAGLPAEDIYRPFRENERDPAESTSDNPASPSWLALRVREFEELCKNALTEDTFILGQMDRHDVFQYEKIVVDPEYFHACFQRLAEGCRRFVAVSTTRRGAVRLECTQDYLDRVFKIGLVNPKASGARSPDEIFASWPNSFKDIFRRNLAQQGGKDAIQRYAGFGYQLPEDMQLAAALRSRPQAARPSSPMPGEPSTAFPPLDLQRAPGRFTPALTAVPSQDQAAKEITAAPAAASERLSQMLAIMDRERAAHAEQLRRLQEIRDAERDVVGARMRDMQDNVNAEREAFTARIEELRHTLEAEREAFTGRIEELQRTLGAERGSFTGRIKELQHTLEAERDAFIARINELQDTLETERNTFSARLNEPLEAMAAERRAFHARIKELQDILDAERIAFRARIQELEIHATRGMAGS
jgi:hypothetical protein